MKVKLADLKFYDYALTNFPDLAPNEAIWLMEDMKTRGQEYTILIDQDNLILDGRQRVLQAMRLGWTEIDAELRTCATEADRQEIADKSNLLRRHMPREKRLALIAKYYQTAKSNKSNKTNIATVNPQIKHPQAKVRQEIKQVAEGLGVPVSTSEADLIVQAIKLAKQGDFSLPDAIEEIRANLKAKRDYELQLHGRDEKPELGEKLSDLPFRVKVFKEMSVHFGFITDIQPTAVWIPTDIREKLQNKRTYIIQL